MTMWYIILLVLIGSTLFGLAYLSIRFAKFAFIGKITANPTKKKFFSLMIVLSIFLLCSLAINLMNAVICLLHFVFFQMVCDLLFFLISKWKKITFKRYYAGICAIFLSLIALSIGWHQAHQVSSVHYTIETPKEVSPLRIALFADSHIGSTFDSQTFANHLKTIQQEKPDILLIAGDFVDDGTSRPEMILACQALGKIQTKYGTYFIYGNHDKGYHNPQKRGYTSTDLLNELRKNNITVLQDEIIKIDQNYYLIGRKDASEEYRGTSRKDMKELTQNLEEQKYKIVVDHQPNDYTAQIKSKVDLVLSGHTHGGQLFPLNKVGEWIGANDKTYGHEKRQQTNFIVTSGISDWAIKFKTGTQSEFIIIDIKKK